MLETPLFYGGLTCSTASTVITQSPFSGTLANRVMSLGGVNGDGRYSTLIVSCASTTGLTYKILLSYDGGSTYDPVESWDTTGARVAANTSITASATVAQLCNCVGATHVKITNTAGTGVIGLTSTQLPSAPGMNAWTTTLGAGTNVVGGVYQDSFSVQVTPTVGTAGYIPGDSIGGILTFASVGAIAGRQIAIDDVTIHDLSHQSIPLTIEWFSATPVGGTYTDGSPLVYPASADYATGRGYTQIVGANWKGFPTHASPTHSVVSASGPLKTMTLAATSLFALIHSDWTGSLTAGDIKVTVSGRRL